MWETYDKQTLLIKFYEKNNCKAIQSGRLFILSDITQSENFAKILHAGTERSILL